MIDELQPPFERLTDDGWVACGDCLELMNSLPDESIDLIVTDPPYGTTGHEWDKALDAAEVFRQYRRILTPTGTACIFGSEPFSTTLRIAALDLFKYDFVWLKDRPSGFQHAKNMPLKNYELVTVFSKGAMGHASLLGDRRMTYNPQGLKPLGKLMHGHRGPGGVLHDGSMGKRMVYQEYTDYPRLAQQWKAEGGDHPNQKPVALLAYLIRTYSNRGEVVLDPTMGSGSTGVAAIDEGRAFVGIELSRDYHAVACERIAQTAAQPRLFEMDG